MPQVEVSLSDELVSEIERMAEGEEFVNREEAVEQLLTAGIEAYTIEYEEAQETDVSEEFAEDIWDTADVGDGETAGDEDDYTF